MTHEEFVGQVQHRAHLASREEAERAIRATFETLAERTEHGAAAHLAAQLPHELGRALTGASEFHRFSLKQFFQKTKEREGQGVEVRDAVYHARVVIEVLREAVSQGAVAKIRAELPPEYAPLFESGSHGSLYPAQSGGNSHPG